MFEAKLSKKSLIKIVVFSSIILLIIFFISEFNQPTRIVFCNVGQGDATYIRTKEKIDILVDAGPNRNILSCLGRYLPFYDRKIELSILSHPQKDHFWGYFDIVDRYSIDYFITTPLTNNSSSFKLLKEKLEKKKIKVKNLYAGEKIFLGKNRQSIVYFLWPTKQYLRENIKEKNIFLEKDVLGIYRPSSDLNNFSLVFLFSLGDFDVLFTGDASTKVLDLVDSTIQKLDHKNIEILKVPHHGSKNGLTKKFLQVADPQLCLISVGKNNSYGHPSKEVITMIQALKKKYLRTDEKGDVVVEVDERGWRVR